MSQNNINNHKYKIQETLTKYLKPKQSKACYFPIVKHQKTSQKI